MNATSITISTNFDIKTKTKKIAKEKGLSVSGMVNSLLKLVINDTSLIEKVSERPTPYLLKAIANALQQKKEGKVSPRFSHAKDAIKWLNRNR